MAIGKESDMSGRYYLSLCTFISNGADGYGSTIGNRNGGVSQYQKKIEMIKTDGVM